MKTQEQIQELKQTSIMRYLAGKGINAVSKSGSYFMYRSPLRNDSTPSFSVNPTKNTFYDLGNESDKGNIIELVMRMESMSFVEACQYLSSQDLMKENENFKTPFLSLSQNPNNEIRNYEVTAVKDLQHPALIRYVENRKISFQNAFKYLNEIHYNNAKGKFFGVGYQTDDDRGYVLRSEIMKKPINLGKSGIKTFAVPNSKNVAVFEGMFDFLSACEFYKGSPTMTAIILNSTSNLNKALPIISQYEKAFCYLDNDNAGWKALDRLKQAGLNVVDTSFIYSDYNDFNDFLIKKPP